eukprot:snap_masked-scaffold_4-processed-gene-3.10-mRNA-1 protein AED:1.00 eAED:1.00 QI:0/0/0/0/1/1/2/0/73
MCSIYLEYQESLRKLSGIAVQLFVFLAGLAQWKVSLISRPTYLDALKVVYYFQYSVSYYRSAWTPVCTSFIKS